MNEAHSYDPDTFHPSMMHSVYVTLDGGRLHLAKPRANIPRWAAFDEPLHEAVFLQTRTYQLTNSKVSILLDESKMFTSQTATWKTKKAEVTSELNFSHWTVCTHFVT